MPSSSSSSSSSASSAPSTSISSPSSTSSSPPSTVRSAASTNASHASRCCRVNRYLGLLHVCSRWVRAKNMIICCHGRTCLTIDCSSMYGCNGWYRVWCISVRMASSRMNMPIRSMTDLWLNRASPSIAFHIAASTGSARCSACCLFRGSISATGSSIHANSSGRSMPAKYGIHCVRSSHGFASSASPSWMVIRRRSSTLAHASCIFLPTSAHAAAPSTGTTSGPPSPGWWTSKYCLP